MNYWLMKSEPDVFGIDKLKSLPNKTSSWDGVRNYQARNFMRDMRKGDFAFFYHSSCPEPGVVGIVKITREAYPDHTSWDKNNEYFDPKSTPERPLWFMVDVKFVRAFPRTALLDDIKKQRVLKNMRLVQRGNRLSVMPVTKSEWDVIVALAEKD